MVQKFKSFTFQISHTRAQCFDVAKIDKTPSETHFSSKDVKIRYVNLEGINAFTFVHFHKKYCGIQRVCKSKKSRR